MTHPAPPPFHTRPLLWTGAILLPWLAWAAEPPGQTGNNENHAPRFEKPESFELPPMEPRSGVSQGSSVAELLGNSVTDVDKNAQLGIAVTATDNANGLWQYSLDNGGTWSEFGQLAESSATLIPASPTARIRFLPDKDYEGKADIQFRAWDQTQGKVGEAGVDASRNGGSNAFSATQEKAAVEIKPLQQFDKSELAGSLLAMQNPTQDAVDRVLLEMMRRGLSTQEASQLLEAVKKKSACTP